jgi:antimicrobial peptide system SdpA family protein
VASHSIGGRNLWRFVLAFAVTWVFWGAAVLFVLDASLPYNPIRLPISGQQVHAWLPEGWGFFTRDPREPDLYVYRNSHNRWETASLGPHSQPRHIFGLSRSSRAQGVELGLLLHRTPHTKWAECRGDPVLCLMAAPTVTVQNPSSSPTLCNELGVILQPPVPWAWSAHKIRMPSKVIRLEVSCVGT